MDSRKCYHINYMHILQVLKDNVPINKNLAYHFLPTFKPRCFMDGWYDSSSLAVAQDTKFMLNIFSRS